MIVQKCRRFDVERFGHMPERNDGDILLAALHRAYMRAVNAHSVRQGGLAEASFLSKKLQVCAKPLPPPCSLHLPVGHTTPNAVFSRAYIVIINVRQATLETRFRSTHIRISRYRCCVCAVCVRGSVCVV